MSDLRPCPFCGGEACMQVHEFVGYRNTYGIVCLDCGAETRQFFMSKSEAEEAWNIRKADRKGKWIEKEVLEDTVINEWQSARCSKCGKYHTTPYMYYFDNFNFCPNCGAKMNEEREE